MHLKSWLILSIICLSQLTYAYDVSPAIPLFYGNKLESQLYHFQLNIIRLVRTLKAKGHNQEQTVEILHKFLDENLTNSNNEEHVGVLKNFILLLTQKEFIPVKLGQDQGLVGQLTNLEESIESQFQKTEKIWKFLKFKSNTMKNVYIPFQLDRTYNQNPVETTATDVMIPGYPRSEITTREVITNGETYTAKPSINFGQLLLSAGPTLTFKKRHRITTWVIGPGHEPIVLKSENETFLNHRDTRRLVYLCQINTESTIAHALDAGASLLGFGASISKEKWDSLTISKSSAPQYVPIVDARGKRTTLNDIIQFCSKVFAPTLSREIEIELKATIAHFEYSNENYECVEDVDCNLSRIETAWFIRQATISTCDSVKRGNFFVNLCRYKSKKGHACPYYKNGKRLTSGQFEYPCRKGLKCTLTQEPGIFSYGKAKCL